MTEYSLWEVILNGDSPVPTRVVKGVVQPVAPTTAEQRLARKNEMKARGTLLMALPDKHQLKFNSHKDAKTLMEVIEKIFDVNLKFRRSLPSEWKTHTLIWKNKADLEEQSLDDLFNSLKIYEAEVKQSSSTGTASQNLAFVSTSHTDSTTGSVSVAASVSAAWAKLPASPFPNVDSLSNAIDVDDLEEIDLRWQMAMLTMWAIRKGHFARECRCSKDLRRPDAAAPQRRTVPVETSTSNDLVSQCDESDYENWPPSNLYDRFQPSGGYHAIPPLYTGTFMPPKPDLVLHTAPTSVETENFAFNVQLSPTKPEQDLSHTTRPSAPIIEEHSVKPIETPIPAATPALASPKTNRSGKRRNRKACFVCKSVDHLIKDCNFHTKKMTKPTQRTHGNKGYHMHYAPLIHSKPHQHLVPTAVLTRSKPVLNTAVRPVSAARPNISVTRPRYAHHNFTKSKSTIRRHITRRPSSKSNNSPPRVTAVKALVVSTAQVTQGTWGNPLHALKDKGVINSGCSRHMTRNMSYLSDFEELNEELKFNLFSVSQMCDKKNSVLFIDTECLVLSPDFQLPDENQVLLRVPRENNMYNVNLKNIIPSGDLTCLFAKATLDESNLWHIRLGHINFKTTNKLVKGNLIRGLPTKVFETDNSCVTCKQSKQHRASCKSKPVSFVDQPLFRLHMDLFRPTFVKSLSKKSYCLVITDDYSRFTWVFFLATKDETSPILKTFFTGLENQLSLKVKVIRSDNGIEFKNSDLNQVLVTKPHNKTPYELLHGRTPSIGFIRPFSCPVTILNTLDPLGKFQGKVDEGFLVGYSVCSKASRVFNSRTCIIQETLHVNFLENKPNVAGTGPSWLFHIDSLTRTMNYQPVHAGNQTNSGAGFQDNFNAEKAGEKVDQSHMLFPVWSAGSTNPQNNAEDAAFDGKEHDIDAKSPESVVILSPSSCAQSKEQDDKTMKEAKGKIPTVGQNYLNNTNTFSAAGPSNDARLISIIFNLLFLSVLFQQQEFIKIILYHKLLVICLQLLKQEEEPKRAHQALKDPSWIEAMQEELLQFKMQKVWVLVDLPYGKRAIGHTHEEGIDYDEVFAPVARIEAIRLFLAYASFMGFMVYQMDVKSAFLYGTIEEEVSECQPSGFEDPDHPDKVYRVVKALYGLHQAPRAWYETLATYLLENGFHRGTIDQTLFIKKQKGDILLVQIYVDDIIFGATNKDLCKSFEKLMKDKFQMSSIGELTFFLGLQVKKKKDGIFISQDKYVAELLRKFRLAEGKSASTLIDTKKPLQKDPDGEDVDVHTYRHKLLLFSLTNWCCSISAVSIVAHLNKSDASEGFNKIIDFLNGSYIKHVLTINPHIYVSCIKQFWTTVVVKQSNNVTRLQALVDKKRVVITEATIRDALCLGDAEGVDCLPNEEIFAKLARELEEQGAAEEQVHDDVEDTVVQRDAIHEPSIPSPIPSTPSPQQSQDLPSTSQDDKDLDKDDAVELMDDEEAKKSKRGLVTASSTTIVAAEPQVPAATITASSVKVAAASTRRRKGVVIRDPEEESTAIIPADTKSKDKGKGIMVEEPKPMKKKQQVEMDEEYARKLHEELNKDIEWNKDWNAAIDHVKQKAKEDPFVQRYQVMKKRPKIEAHAQKNMMIYLKNVAGFRLDYFKGMSYDDIPQKAAKRKKLNKEVEDLKQHLEIVPDEDDDVDTEATPLARKGHTRWTSSSLEESKDYPWSSKVERRYPLSRFTLDQLLNAVRLRVEEQSEMSLELLRTSQSVSQVSESSKKDLEDLFQDFYDEYFDSSKIMKSSTMNVDTSINEEVFHESISNNKIPNGDEASTSHNMFNERLEDAYFDASTSFHDPSNIYTNYQPYPHEKKWTKDHPLHKIIGDPKSSVRTRGQLANTCLFSCLLSSVDPANVAEALRDADWLVTLNKKALIMMRRLHQLLEVEAIRLFLAYAAHKNFTVFQMDVKITFLNGVLTEEVYVGQPLVFVSKQYPDHVYALDKALYGLKLAPRAWYDVLS
nr:putative ribonuclease H-like domain-containing protein [Tanacetum cinerariifolium]